MVNIFNKLYITLIFLLFISNILSAQIFSPDADYADTTEYKNDSILGIDSIFVFYSPITGGREATGTLLAKYNDSTSLEFIWQKYDTATYVFQNIINPDITISPDSSFSVINELKTGGYRVIISGTNINDTLRAWIFINDMVGYINYESSCHDLVLSGIRGGENFYYYDLIDSTKLYKQNGLIIEWTSDPPSEYNIPANKRVVIDPPYENTTYSVHVSDSFGNEKSHQRYIYAIATKPDFSASKNGEIEKDSLVSGEAPFKIQFVADSSKNAEEFKWIFYNDRRNKKFKNDSIIGTSLTEIPTLPIFNIDSIIYYRPGLYDVALITSGPLYELEGDETRCMDTLIKYEYIKVDSSLIGEIPNVFVPGMSNFNINKNGEGFRLHSIKKFEIIIYNRWGKKVYEYYDNSGDWEGWDGTIKSEGREASPGVYFYVIKAVGWDDKVHPEIKKGFVHLFR